MTYDNTDNNDDGTVEADIDNQSVSTDAINTEDGFVSGLLLNYVSSAQVSLTPGLAIADDDMTVIDVESTLTADISTTGTGGRQSGLAEQSNSWYEVFVIDDSSASNPAAFLVEEGQTLSLPSGYDIKRSLGWIRNNSNSDITTFYNPKPGVYYYQDPNNQQVLDSSSPATTYSSVSLSDTIPPTASEAKLNLQSVGDGSSGAHSIEVIGRSTDPAVFSFQGIARGWAANGGGDAMANVTCLVDNSQSINYRTISSAQARIYTAGWVDPR